MADYASCFSCGDAISLAYLGQGLLPQKLLFGVLYEDGQASKCMKKTVDGNHGSRSEKAEIPMRSLTNSLQLVYIVRSQG